MPTKYIEVNLNISDHQKEKIKLAINNKEPTIIRIEDRGNDLIALTESQINRINKAFEKGKGVNIKLSVTQLNYNKNKVQGGFIGPLLAMASRVALPLATRVLPQVAKHLGIGALTGLASTGISKLFGNGMYLKKNGCVCKVKQMGEGVFLQQKNPSELETVGDGLYIRDKASKEWYDGSGILSQLTAGIPLLNMII